MQWRRIVQCVVVAMTVLACAWPAVAQDAIDLYMRHRVEDGQGFKPAYKREQWDPAKTAIVVCDMWNTMRNEVAANRVAELAARMDAVLAAARDRGVLVIHAPSGTVDHYADTPQRRRCLEAPAVETDVPLEWQEYNEEREGPWPIDDTDGGWEGPTAEGEAPQSRQHPAITIADEDAIGEGAEVYYLLEQEGIENVILMGVHTNMCILGRPFGIRQLVYLGKNVALMRDMTDSLYDPEMNPKVSHYRGTELVIEHIEKYWCPTVTSTSFTGEASFRFAGDDRPHAVFIVSDDHYDADKTLPPFAQMLREEYGLDCTVLHGGGEADIPHTAELAHADVAVVYVRRLGLPADQVRDLKAYCNGGGNLVGLRTANHAFKMNMRDPEGFEVPEGRAEWPEFDAAVLGGNYHGHAPNELESDVRIVADHPITANIEPRAWHSTGSLYYTSPIADDATLLMEGDVPDRTEPLTWVREYAGGRVFYSSLGHPDDFGDAPFVTMIVNAIHWCMGEPVPAE